MPDTFAAPYAAISNGHAVITDTALRDIQDLVEKGILARDEGGGRSTSYSLVQKVQGSRPD